MKKFKPFITTIFGNSCSGKTTLANSFNTHGDYLYIDCANMSNDYLIDCHIDKSLIEKGKPQVLFNKLRHIDPKVVEVVSQEVDDSIVFEAVLHDGSIVPFNKISKKYSAILNIILLLRNKKNLILDNFDSLFIGSANNNIYNMIIKEIDINNTKTIFTFTDLTLWQSLSLAIPLEMGKKFIVTKYDPTEDSYDNMVLDYKKLAYSVNFLYDRSLKKSIEEDRPMRPSDCREI